MFKAALLCSAVCTAFVLGDPSSKTPAGKPATKLNLRASIHDVLQRHVGKKCRAIPAGPGHWYLSFRKQDKGSFKFDMLGEDFIRLTNEQGKSHVLFSSIREINTD